MVRVLERSILWQITTRPFVHGLPAVLFRDARSPTGRNDVGTFAEEFGSR